MRCAGQPYQQSLTLQGITMIVASESRAKAAACRSLAHKMSAGDDLPQLPRCFGVFSDDDRTICARRSSMHTCA